VTLFGREREGQRHQVAYIGSLRIQDSEKEANVLGDRIMKTNDSSWSRTCACPRFSQDVVARDIELYQILVEELHVVS